MGVDAKMYVRYEGGRPTEEQLNYWNNNLKNRIYTRSYGFDFYPISVLVTNAYSDEYDYNEKLIETNDNYTTLDLNINSRYYEKYWSSGNILYMCSVAEWVEYNFKDYNFEILYGKDNGGDFLNFNKEYREKLKEHFFNNFGNY
jgi:hypothetical protein